VLARAHVIDVKFTGGLVSNGTLDHAALSVVALVLGWGWGGWEGGRWEGCGGRRKERKERRGRQEERGGEGGGRRGESRRGDV
jgi:hypothetical protein